MGSIIDYFNKYPLLGIKGKDFKDWEVVYNMLISKQHLTESGRLKIISIDIIWMLKDYINLIFLVIENNLNNIMVVQLACVFLC